MLSIVWLLMLIVAMVVHHWRGLWLLFGAPLALFWPTVMVLFANAIADCAEIIRSMRRWHVYLK
jgi:hypothetical protein